MRCLLLLSLLTQAISTSLFAADAVHPNIILIYTDDQGWGDASCLNPEAKFQTPNLDRLAREGISFTDAHSSDTVCTPSRYGLLTGRYSWRTTLKRGVFGAERACLIADGRMTLPSLLRQHGYATAMVGKWHLGMDFPGEAGNRDWTLPVRDMPLDKGFDYYFGIPASMNYGVLAWFEGRFARIPPTHYTAKKPNSIAISDYRIMPPYQATAEQTRAQLGTVGMEVASDFVDSECLTRFTDNAIDWIETRARTARDTPFFLYLPFTSPHKPVIPLPEFRGRGEAGAYGEFMLETDHHIGRILDLLDVRHLAANTLVIFTSDNGPENTWRERARRFGHQSNGPFREGKRSIYEGGHRVPFFVRWPQGIDNPGRTCNTPICQTDILSTVAELVGASLPDNAGEDSHSFLAVLHGADPPTRPPIVHHAANGRFAIRDGAWKLVMAHRKSAPELYHLQDDSAEQDNLIDRRKTEASRLTDSMNHIVVTGRSTAGASQQNDTGYWDDLAWLEPDQYEALIAGQVSAVPDNVRTSFSLDAFYQKHLDVGGLPVVGSKRVSDAAIKEAAWIVRKMIGHRPDILQAMAKNKTRLAVMAYNEYTTDVPEHRHLKSRVYWDRRARGLGATKRAPAVSCAEENVLCHPGDPYSTENICIHEFAHAIHSMGMPDIDPQFDSKLKQAYDRARMNGLWKETYAETNHSEYWAEGIQSWFDDNREHDALHNHVDTRAELKAYDPPLAALCVQVFGDRSWRYRKPMLRSAEERQHLVGVSFDTLPRFQWRDEPIPDRPRVLIQTAMGDIEVELDARRAPKTTANFLHYVHQGLYSDGEFHRTVTANNQPKDKVKIRIIQARADPRRESEFPAAIPLERTSETGLRHRKSTISMARDTAPDTARDHFFICLEDQPELDFAGGRDKTGQGYAAFGVVTKGMDVVEALHWANADGQTLKPPIRIQRAVRLN